MYIYTVMKRYSVLYESSIYDYLIWEPTGKLQYIADELDKITTDSSKLYRGMSEKEYNILKTNGKVTSKGRGNTRNISGSYLASDFKLAARFALVNYRDKGEGIIVVVNKSKLPDLKNVDPGNYVTSYIPIEAVTKIINLKKL
jgi:hypothetical protein